MAEKRIILSDVQVRTGIFDNQRTREGTPDPYILFRSKAGAAGDRSEFKRNDRYPRFPGPYAFGLGGPAEVEQVRLELWDYDGGASTNDDLMESAVISLEGEAPEGTRSWRLSEGGEVAFTWRITGRAPAAAPEPTAPEPTAPEPTAPEPAAASVAGTTVRISRVAAVGLLPRDGRRGVVDPYVVLTGKSVPGLQERWSTLQNDASPVWEVAREVRYDPAGYSVEVWDSDTSSGDDLCGAAELKLDLAGTEVKVDLVLQYRGRTYDGGDLILTYSSVAPAASTPAEAATPAEETPAVPAAAGPSIVVRKEIRKMPEAEQARFAAALRRLMENKQGPQTSEFFRIAGYHGWPSDFCHHGQETFPGWHRGYCVELERALVQADKELGGDGGLGLPYWDWSEEEVEGQVVPKIVRDAFPELPDGFLEPSQAGSLGRRGFSQLHSDAEVSQRLRSSRTAFQAEQCLAVAEHWMHASTRFNRQGYPVEAPHNSVHMACGFPMTSLRYAAFHPCFWLHHCNVDRIYEKHVQLETPSECHEEFASRQAALAARGEENRFQAPLDPFKHPFEDRPLMPSDTFDTRSLGYVYDQLPKAPAMMLREEPVFAAFLKVRVLELKRKSYMLHVFVLHKSDTAKWSAPQGGPSGWTSDGSYAGSGSIFGGKGQDCCNCREREPYNVLVEVQEALSRQKLSRHDASLRVMCQDEEGEVCALEDTPVPMPVLVGPVFEDSKANLSSAGSEWAKQQASGEVAQLQGILTGLGYAPGQVDGLFGPETEAAVQRFQRFMGLKEDGVAGPKTKAQLLSPRWDLHPDVAPTAQKGEAARFVEGSTVPYLVGPLPGYLGGGLQDRTLAEIDEAFARWGAAMGVQFARTPSGVRARLRVEFDDLSALGESLAGGVARPGGQLAEATRQGVRLDAAERWLLRGQKAPEHLPKAVALFPVLLHEVGHVLGLAHSADPRDVMWPYCKPGELDPRLSPSDKARARASVTAPASTVARTSGAGSVALELASMRSELAGVRQELVGLRAEVAAMRAAGGTGAGPQEATSDGGVDAAGSGLSAVRSQAAKAS